MCGSHSLAEVVGIIVAPVVVAVDGRQIFHTLFQNHIVGTKLVAHSLIDGVVLLSKLISLMPLPSVAPTAIEAAHSVGIRSGDENLHALLERKDIIIVFEQHFAFLGSTRSKIGMLLAAEFGIVLEAVVRLVEEVKAIFQSKNAAHSIVDAAHRHLTLLHQLLKQSAEVGVVRLHSHINSGIDSNADSILLVGGNVVASVEVVDIGPVSHHHTVPVELFL